MIMKIGTRGHDLIAGLTDVKNLAEKMRAFDLDTLQLVCHKSIAGIPYAPGVMNRDKALSVSESLKENNADVTLIGAYFNPVHPMREKAELGARVFEDNLLLAEAIGGGTVGSETGSFNGDKWTYHPENRTAGALKTVMQTFSGLAESAAGLGVSIGIEGAAGHVCYNVGTLRNAVKGIDADNVKIIFDYFNFMESGNTDYIKILDEGLSTFEGIHCFHIKDCVIREKPEQCPVGSGELDFTRILRMIKQYDPHATLILEGTTSADLPNAVKFIREIWDGV